MAWKKAEIHILTVLLLLTSLYFGTREPRESPSLSFEAVTDHGTETIRVWQRDDGDGFVFLPSYVNLNQLRILTTRPVCIGETKMTYGKTCEDLELDRTYFLSGTEGPSSMTFLRSENLPAMYLDTVSGSMDYIDAEKGNEEAGSLRLYDERGELVCRGNLESVKARGNASFYMDKKPYSLKFNSKQDVLGMGGAKKWILLANAYDGTHLKDKLVYDFARDAGLAYSPESRWVDVYFNGNYAGLYLLCERNEVDAQRVDLPDGKGFLVSKEQPYNAEKGVYPYFVTDAGAYLRVHSNTLAEGEMEQIFQSAENAILAENGADPITGKYWSELIDVDSWARKYLVEEIFGGIDAGVASQFFYYQPQNGKLYAGPVWDYDAAMSTVIGLEDGIPVINLVPEMFFAHRGRSSPWFNALYYRDEFYDRVTRLYNQEFCRLLEQYIEKIPEYEDQIRQGAYLNQIRWSTGNPESMIQTVRCYLTDRMTFLSKAWSGDANYVEVHVDYTYERLAGQYFAFDYAVIPGETLPELLTADSLTWYITGTDIPFDTSQPIEKELSIQLRQNK